MSLRPSLPNGFRRAPVPISSRLGLLAILSIVGGPVYAGAQEATIRVEENFRAEPNGTILGHLAPGTRVTLVEEEGNWTRATIRGFMWTPSLQDRPASNEHNLVVAEPGGENLRDQPAGRIAGHLITGTVLEELERIPGWVEVRRTGWIWTSSLDAVASATPPTAATPPVATAAPPTSSPTSADWLRGGAPGATILTAPDGDTLGHAQPGSELRVVSREGNWARVQLEGWVWIPSLEDGYEPGSGEPAVMTGIPAGDLSREYDRYRGRLIEIRLQYISLERAEQVRTDFLEGEPFLLTRSTDEDRSFVYVAVPPEHLEQARTLTPLETIRVLARVRAGAAAFTGSPILDLVELERVR